MGHHPDNVEEFNTSRFTELPNNGGVRPSNNMGIDQSSSALIDEEPYSGKQDVTNPFTQTTPHVGPPGSTIRPGRAGQFVD